MAQLRQTAVHDTHAQECNNCDIDQGLSMYQALCSGFYTLPGLIFTLTA